MENINVKVINQNNVDIKVTPQVSNVVEVVTPQPFSIKIDKGTVGPQGPQGPAGPAGEGVSTGGTTGQALVKTSDADYDTEWSDTVPNATNADNATYATSAGSALTADSAINADHVPYSGLTGTVPTWNQDTTGNAATATHATTADSATLSGNVTGIVAVANGGTGADNADSARSNLSAAKSGANSDITSLSGITGGISTADFVQFDTAYATTLGVGQIGWDGNNTLGLGMAGGNVVQKIGEDFFYYVKASSAIAKGQLCMFTGSVGASGVVTAAPATGVTNGQYIMGVAAEAMSNNAFGLVQVFGTLRNVDTSAFADGDVLYYNSAVIGGFTTTFPASGPIVTCAAVVKGGSSGGGVLQVRITNTQRLTAGSGITVTQNGTGTTISNASPSTGGTVTSVGTAGTVNGLTLTGGPITTSGTITLGGTLDLSSPPAIGGTTPAAGTFTTLTSTGQTSLGGAAGSEGLRVTPVASAVNYIEAQGATTTNWPSLRASGGDANISPAFISKGSGSLIFSTNNSSGNNQFRVAHTASAVNYVQVTGAATGAAPSIQSTGTDATQTLLLLGRGNGGSVTMGASSTVLWFKAAGTSTGQVVNYLQAAASTTTNSPILSAQGSDTNISQVFQSKGTGAIDLAAGSSGVNISNGGTVTAITLTSAGSNYTTNPTATVTAPTTAGGVQAVLATTIYSGSSTVLASGGTGYSVNDVLTFSGGTSTTAAQYTVTAVSGGVITAVSRTTSGAYTAAPSNPVSVTGGTGTGATFTANWSVNTPTITNAGSGYVEQPTVSFSGGGGGSGAAAYATVGGNAIVKGIGPTMSFYAPNGEAFRVADGASTSAFYWQALGTSAQGILRSSGATAQGLIQTSGTGGLFLQTNAGVTQAVVAHTASAVNYVQVTGAATGAAASALGGISFTGSDANPNFAIGTKGTGYIAFYGGAATNVQAFRVNTTSAATTGNLIQVQGAAAGSAPSIQAISGTSGTDTNIDLALTPKGTGRVQFGTYTGTALSIAGYIEIKDSGGTVRKLAVVA